MPERWIVFTKYLPYRHGGVFVAKKNLTKWEKHFIEKRICTRRVKRGNKEALEILVDDGG